MGRPGAVLGKQLRPGKAVVDGHKRSREPGTTMCERNCVCANLPRPHAATRTFTKIIFLIGPTALLGRQQGMKMTRAASSGSLHGIPQGVVIFKAVYQ